MANSNTKTTSNATKMQDAAIDLIVKRDFYVFPCHGINPETKRCTCGKADCGSPGKHPRTKNGVKDATNDPVVVRNWGALWEGANLAVATGKLSGITVIDVDRHGDVNGNNLLQALEIKLGKLPLTLASATGGELPGAHFYVKYIEGPLKKILGPGIDIQNDGKYVLAEPSRTFQNYLFDDPDAMVMQAPAAWLDLLCKPSMNGDPQEPPLDPKADIYTGTRDRTLYRWACKYRGDGDDYDTMRSKVGKINAAKCKDKHGNPDPLTDAEVDAKCKSACEHPQGAMPSTGLPTLNVPGGATRVTDAAAALAGHVRKAYYNRDGYVFQLLRGVGGKPDLRIVDPAEFVSGTEKFVSWGKTTKGKTSPVTLTKGSAEQLLKCEEFRNSLDEIRSVSDCPILVVEGGKLVEVSRYHKQSGVFAAGGPLPEVSLVDAVENIREVYSQFGWIDNHERNLARAVSALITPALLAGGLIPGGRTPLFVYRSDLHQAGKTTLTALTPIVYGGQPASLVLDSHGDVSPALSAELQRGTHFVDIDNVEGLLRNSLLASAITSAGKVTTKCSYSRNLMVRTSHVNWSLSSQKLTMTTEMEARSVFIDLKKHEDDFAFKRYDEGTLLEHVAANQPIILASVHAIIREWFAEGRQETNATAHDFRPWCGILDWIVQRVLKMPALFAGGGRVGYNATNRERKFAAHLADLISQAGLLDKPLWVGEILKVSQAHMFGEFGVDESIIKTNELALGKKLAGLFQGGQAFFGAVTITRECRSDSARHQRTAYIFSVREEVYE